VTYIKIIRDWILYHGYLFGFDNLFIIDNMSSDGSSKKLLGRGSIKLYEAVQVENEPRSFTIQLATASNDKKGSQNHKNTIFVLNLSKETEPVKSNLWGIAASIAAGMVLITLTAAFQKSGIAVMPAPSEGIGLVKNLGRVLMTEYLVPFELSGILFISAMVGAVLLGKRDKNSEELVDLNNKNNA
jgi:hypothetical protein